MLDTKVKSWNEVWLYVFHENSAPSYVKQKLAVPVTCTLLALLIWIPWTATFGVSLITNPHSNPTIPATHGRFLLCTWWLICIRVYSRFPGCIYVEHVCNFFFQETDFSYLISLFFLILCSQIFDALSICIF